jgi:hypothetical protein
VKIQIIGGKVYLKKRAKHCWVISAKLFFSKIC